MKKKIKEFLEGGDVEEILERLNTSDTGMGVHRFTRLVFDPRFRYVDPEQLKGITAQFLTDKVEGFSKGECFEIVDYDLEMEDWRGIDPERNAKDPTDDVEGTLTLRNLETSEEKEIDVSFFMDLYKTGHMI